MTRTPLSERVGQRYGRWFVEARANRPLYLVCVCDCGTRKEVFVSSLARGKSVSCGCHRREVQRALHTTHGQADNRNRNKTRAYYAWTNMKTRCYNRKHKDFHNYGGRGIRVCARWRNSFEAFYEDVGDPPPRRSLDRIDVDGHYEPGNVRWATAKQQANNRQAAIIW